VPKTRPAATSREQPAGRTHRHHDDKRRKPTSEPVEVFLTEPGEGRPDFEPGVLDYLPADAPLPQVGDILLLPRASTGDAKAEAYAWGGVLSPFRVVEREHLYHRGATEKIDPRKPAPAHYLKTLLLVRRVPKEEYYADPGQAVMPVAGAERS
jgi:hypothetical protein